MVSYAFVILRVTSPKAWLLFKDFDVFLYSVKTVVCAPMFTKTVLLRGKIRNIFRGTISDVHQ